MQCKYKNSTEEKFCAHYIESHDDIVGLCSLPSQFRCIEKAKSSPMMLSHSSLQNFLRCKRCYYYSNIMGIRVKPERLSRPMLMGSLWDKIQSAQYDGENGEKDMSLEYYDILNYMDEFSIAKVDAVVQAASDIGLKPVLEGYVGSQIHFEYITDDIALQGFYDRKYTDHFVEMKFSGSPQYYSAPFDIENQVGTYFMADENMKYCIVEVTQAPQQRPLQRGKNRTMDESAAEFQKRIYEAIIKQPSKYFIGLNRSTMTWGKRFYRSEFDLVKIEKRYSCVTTEVQESMERGWYYQNTSACNLYGGKCDFYPICKSGGYVSDGIYTRREKII